MRGKTQKRFQWVALIGAIAVAAQQLVDAGAIQPEHAVWALVVTNVLSAVLPSVLGAVEKK